jgi:16S rRNA A1518/A1519 N6-dimethyltransferase RsmA/KsgA/DIM1 with predicted DNA glycosylase/AP lyase activity
MATGLERMVRSLREFYDCTSKTVIAVGAGGGLAQYAQLAASVLAVEKDAAAVERLTESVRQRGVAERFTILRADFLSVHSGAGVVLFEFCLHEMPPHSRAVG